MNDEEFIVDDSGLPCTAAGLGGVLIPESAEIVELCQDPNSTDVIYMWVNLIGAYLYDHRAWVIIDNTEIEITGLLIPNYKGEGVTHDMIDTECGGKTLLFGYSVGAAIEGYASIPEFDVKIQFFGHTETISTNPIVNDVFRSVNPSDTKTLVKGVTPDPYVLFFDPNTNTIRASFIGLGDEPCFCAINCVTPSADDFNVTTCEDEAQEVTIDATSIVGDPTNVTITFVDSRGNSTDVDVNIVVNMKPMPPFASWAQEDDVIRVGFAYQSINGTQVDPSKVMYRILKYENNPDNNWVFKGWSSKPWTNFIDSDVKPEKTYGYAVEFMGEFGEMSNISDWTVVPPAQ
ncbi:MAG: hypothetical protein D6710_01870 [Nitrospirae bacterium]|nr:MAG: hypothetical protein D6710_01870 [Nitrospirota bacterium]